MSFKSKRLFKNFFYLTATLVFSSATWAASLSGYPLSSMDEYDAGSTAFSDINVSEFLAHTSPSSLPWQMDDGMDEMVPEIDSAIGHIENRTSQSGANPLWNVRNEFPPHTPSPLPWSFQEEVRSGIEDGSSYNPSVNSPNLSFLADDSYEEEATVSVIGHIEDSHSLPSFTNSSKDEMDKGDEKDSDIARDKSEAAEPDHETPIVPDHIASSSKQHSPSRAERRQIEWQKKQREQYLKIQEKEKNKKTKTKIKKKGQIK